MFYNSVFHHKLAFCPLLGQSNEPPEKSFVCHPLWRSAPIWNDKWISHGCWATTQSKQTTLTCWARSLWERGKRTSLPRRPISLTPLLMDASRHGSVPWRGRPNLTEPNQIKPNLIKPNLTEPILIKPNKTLPNQIKSNLTQLQYSPTTANLILLNLKISWFNISSFEFNFKDNRRLTLHRTLLPCASLHYCSNCHDGKR